MVEVKIMRFLKIMTIIFLTQGNLLAIEVTDKASKKIIETKEKGKNLFKTLTRKSLSKNEIVDFLSNYVIILDDNMGDGIVTYYFYDKIYIRYKDLEILSQDFWYISKLGSLKLFYDDAKVTWKIQPSKINTLNIRMPHKPIGKLYEFSYENKTEFYLKLEEKKIK